MNAQEAFHATVAQRDLAPYVALNEVAPHLYSLAIARAAELSLRWAVPVEIAAAIEAELVYVALAAKHAKAEDQK